MLQSPLPLPTLTRRASEGERSIDHIRDGAPWSVRPRWRVGLVSFSTTARIICIAGLTCVGTALMWPSREVSAADGNAAQPVAVRLAYKFQPNQSLHFDYSQDMTIHSRKKQFQQTIQSQTKAEKHLRVISVDADGNTLIEPVIDRARLSHHEDDGPESTFDSADGPDECPAAYRGILATVGKPLVRIKFAPTGKLLAATGVNGGGAAAAGLESEPSLNFLIVLPDHPVKVGDTWKDDFEVNVQIDKSLKQGVKLRREYRLAKLDDSRAEIELKMGTLTPINNPSIELQVISRILSGTIVFDHQAGQIVSRDVRVDREVINALGEGSLVRTSMTQIERAVSNPKLAKREARE